MKLFYSESNFSISYKQLIEDINRDKTYKYINNHNDYYSIFRDLIVSILNNSEIIVIDNDLSLQEVEKLKISENDLSLFIECNFPDIKDLSDLLERLNNSPNWQISLYTSGTTGTPKKITHNFSTITRMVKISKDRNNDVWGFAYNPTHIAGLQVFFQALLNLNHIVRLFQLPIKDIYENIEKFQITNISATPTFYRLIKDPNRKFFSVKRISSGGEKFDTKLFNDLKIIFPNAKILNIYASTEFGTLFASEGENFIVKAEYKNKIKVLNSELYVHHSLLGKISEEYLIDDWYKTGDKVEIIKEEPLTIKILGRESDFVNIGGYKVLTTEVEEIINSIPGVVKSKVYPKKNSVTGNVLACEVEVKDKTLTDFEIFTILSKKIQDYKIPRLIKIVDKIEITKSGKIKRL